MDRGSCNSFNGSKDEEDEDESRMDELQEEESNEGGEIFPSSFGVGDRTGSTGGATNDELEKFRRQWRSEINSQNLSCGAQPSPFAAEVHSDADRGDLLTSSDNNNNNNNKDTGDYNAGVNAEKLRVALNVLEGGKKPTKVDDHDPVAAADDDDEKQKVGSDEDDDDEKQKVGSDEDDDDDCDAKPIRIAMDSIICKPAFKQEATHISDLPLEVLDLIFKWVVSSYLDVRSLEMLSMVCKSFYLLARDEDLWKAICMRTWEKSGLSPGYSSYRQMFLERPHVMFNGCYISKATYFRAGEKSFDGFYRPFHLVKYYRYIRFYPEGKVYMFMSPEQPKKAVAYLRSKSNYVQGLQYGYYKLSDDKVSLVLKKIPEPSVKPKRYAKNLCYYADYEQTFFLEMSLKSTKRHKNSQLNWLKYFMHRVNKSTNENSSMTFDISDNMYPSFYFYPVRSFAAQSEFPL